jgi:hypothetical protein
MLALHMHERIRHVRLDYRKVPHIIDHSRAKVQLTFIGLEQIAFLREFDKHPRTLTLAIGELRGEIIYHRYKDQHYSNDRNDLFHVLVLKLNIGAFSFGVLYETNTDLLISGYNLERVILMEDIVGCPSITLPETVIADGISVCA